MNSYRIVPEISIHELFLRWPVTIPVFIQYRMSCVGCSMASFDTLQEAMANYGLDEVQFIAELEAASATNGSQAIR
jgi:hybrid cluster-associated redox disulfide protein